ncbi:MAG TPA: MFS transporter [Pyrinomonadaceae bacterium]|nr:MFS transporter [Pyrinomonadaceae bacterium]
MIDKQTLDQTRAHSIDQAGAQPTARSLRMFRALSHPNYRRFWISAFISNVGTWMQAVAQGWLVLQLTNSPFWLGLDGFMATVPGFFLTLAGGVFADLVDRRRLLIYTQVVAGLSALILAILVHTGTVNVWWVLALSFVTGCCMALASPSYQAITIDLVGREDLANAVALNSSQFQLSRLVGPLLAGLGFKFFDLAGCFYANSVSFLAVIIGFSKLQIEREKSYAHSVKDRKALWQDLLAGFTYVRRRPRVFSLLSLSAVTSLFGTPYLTFIPVFARDIVHLGETGLALMMGAAGAGAFFGALTLAYLGDFKHKGWSVLGGAIAFGVWLIAFAQSTSVTFSLISLFGVGFAVVTSVAVTNTLLQKLVTDEMRGRVMSMFIVSFIGTMPIGNLIGGALSQRFGAPATLTGAGLVIIVFVTGMAIGNKRLRNLH